MDYVPGCTSFSLVAFRIRCGPGVQEYGMRKRLEHILKSTVLDGETISVTDPRTYCTRFRKYMRDVFVPAPET